MIFPVSATNEERDIAWRKIAEISDKDFGFTDLGNKSDKSRFGVRIILKDSGEIYAIKSEKHGFYQLPGGGIDSGESITDALRREVREETGFLIDAIRPLGYTIEHRESIRNQRPQKHDISFVFEARTVKNIGTNYMDDEVEEGFKPVRIKVEDLVIELSKDEGKIQSYNGCFSNRRDLEIAKYYTARKRSLQ